MAARLPVGWRRAPAERRPRGGARGAVPDAVAAGRRPRIEGSVGPAPGSPQVLVAAGYTGHGFGFAWRASDAPGARIVDARLEGVPIDPAARYRVTVNSFLAEGGDGFVAFRDGTDRLGGGLDVQVLVDALQAAPVVTPPAEPRVRVQGR